MVRFGTFEYLFNETFENVTLAFWNKYPNPISSHVLSVDTISREVDDNGRLCTTRLLTKVGKKPQWMMNIFPGTLAYVIEVSTLDPKERKLTTFTKNITLTSICLAEEKCVYTVSKENANWTMCETSCRVSSNLTIGRGMIESFGMSRFKGNAVKTKAAIQHVLDNLREGGMKSAS
eukprot:m.62177 g.62177  ORF g.62177 m.62177 type:complete len:176 (-) comp11492_c0_seq2:61-588(-)